MNIASQQLSEAIPMLMGKAHPAQIEMGALEIDWIRWYQSLASTTESAYQCLPGVQVACRGCDAPGTKCPARCNKLHMRCVAFDCGSQRFSQFQVKLLMPAKCLDNLALDHVCIGRHCRLRLLRIKLLNGLLQLPVCADSPVCVRAVVCVQGVRWPGFCDMPGCFARTSTSFPAAADVPKFWAKAAAILYISFLPELEKPSVSSLPSVVATVRIS